MAIDTMIPGNLMLKSEMPQGEFASKVVKAVHTDTRNTIFPTDSIYGRDWRHAINVLKQTKTTSQNTKQEYKTQNYVTMRNNGLGDKVELSLDHPLEGRNNPQPSKVGVKHLYITFFRLTFHYSD